jgi:hypothetical protein
VLPVGEVIPALADTGCSAEVVDRNRGDATLGEAQRELFVEAVQAANVGENRDPVARGRFRDGGERRKPRPVSRLEDEIPVRDGGAGDGGHRRLGIELEAHYGATLALHG